MTKQIFPQVQQYITKLLSSNEREDFKANYAAILYQTQAEIKRALDQYERQKKLGI